MDKIELIPKTKADRRGAPGRPKSLEHREAISFARTMAIKRRRDAERYLGRLLDQAAVEHEKARDFPPGSTQAVKHQLTAEALTAKARDHQRLYSSVFRDEPELKPCYPVMLQIVERRKVELTPDAVALLAEIDRAEKAAKREVDRRKVAMEQAADMTDPVDARFAVQRRPVPKSTERPQTVCIRQGQIDDGKRRAKIVEDGR